MTIRQRALLAAIANWSARLVELAVGFFLTPFVLHRFGDTHYGIYMLVGAVIGQGALLDLGISPALIKYVAQYRAQGEDLRLRSLIASAQVLYSCIGLLAMLLVITLAAFFPVFFNVPPSEHETARIVVLLMGTRLVISIPYKTSAAVLWGLHRYIEANAVVIFGAIASAAMTVAILLAGGGIVAVAAASIAVTLAMQAISVWYVHRIAPQLRFGWRGAQRETIRALTSFTSSLTVADIAFNIQSKADEIIIGSFLAVSSVSPYSIAGRLGSIPHLLAGQALGGFIPLTSELQASGDLTRLRLLFLTGSRITLAICVPLAGVLVALAGPLLALWVGAKYAAYAPILAVLALAGVAEISHWPGQLILQGIGRYRGFGPAYVCAAIVKLILATLLVRFYGLIGVAIGTLVSAAALSVMYVFPYTMRVVGVSLYDLLRYGVLPPLLPALPMVAIMYAVEWAFDPSGVISVGCTALVGLMTYAILYVRFCAGNHELKLLEDLRSRVADLASRTANFLHVREKF